MIVGSRTACPGKSSVDDFRAKDDHVANPKSANRKAKNWPECKPDELLEIPTWNKLHSDQS